MGKPAIAITFVILALAGILTWRVRLQDAQRHGPVGGSTTVEGTETVVASKVAGRLRALSAREGDRVEAGQAVGELECNDPRLELASAQARRASAEAQLQAAEASVAQARRTEGVSVAQIRAVEAQSRVVDVDQEQAAIDLRRSAQLHDAGAESDALFDASSLRAKNLARQQALLDANDRTARASSAATEAAVRTSLAQVEAGKALVGAADSDVDRAQVSVDECRLVVPRAGLVTERLFEPGVVLAPGTPVLNVIDLSTVKALFFVPDDQLGRVAIGDRAELRVDAYPKRVFDGHVRRIASQAEFTPRDVQTREDRDRLVYAVEVELDNADGALRDGMPGDIVLPPTGTDRRTAIR